MAATILTPAELATELGTDPRTARKFLRSITPKSDQPGKGSRWAIEKKSLRSLRVKWVAFETAQAEARAAREAAKALETVTVENESHDDEGESEPTADEIDAEQEPTAEELAEFDD